MSFSDFDDDFGGYGPGDDEFDSFAMLAEADPTDASMCRACDLLARLICDAFDWILERLGDLPPHWNDFGDY